MKRIALIATVLATPAAAQDCYEAASTLDLMQKNGYIITFGDTAGEMPFFMAEDGKGGWVVFALRDGVLCAVAGGSQGVRAPLKPNA